MVCNAASLAPAPFLSGLGLEKVFFFPCTETGTPSLVTDAIAGRTLTPAVISAGVNCVRMRSTPMGSAPDPVMYLDGPVLTQPGTRDWMLITVMGAVDNPDPLGLGPDPGNAPVSIYLDDVRLHTYFSTPGPVTSMQMYTGSPAPSYNYGNIAAAYALAPSHHWRPEGTIYALCVARRGNIMEHYVLTATAGGLAGILDWDLLDSFITDMYPVADNWSNAIWEDNPVVVIGHSRFSENPMTLSNYQQDVYGIEFNIFDTLPAQATIVRMLQWSVEQWPDGLKLSALHAPGMY